MMRTSSEVSLTAGGLVCFLTEASPVTSWVMMTDGALWRRIDLVRAASRLYRAGWSGEHSVWA